MAVALTSCLDFVLNRVAVFVFMLIYGVQPRDVASIWGVITQVPGYASPIFYTIETVANRRLARVYLFNPIAMVMQRTRHRLVGGTPWVPAWVGGYICLLVPPASPSPCSESAIGRSVE
jgi:ABC-type polysaccharide/polyol phosphate export permease